MYLWFYSSNTTNTTDVCFDFYFDFLLWFFLSLLSLISIVLPYFSCPLIIVVYLFLVSPCLVCSSTSVVLFPSFESSFCLLYYLICTFVYFLLLLMMTLIWSRSVYLYIPDYLYRIVNFNLDCLNPIIN